MCVNKRSDCRDITHLLVAGERPHLYFRHGKVPANTRSCREFSLRQLQLGLAHPVSPRKAAIVFRIDDHFSLAGGQQVFRDPFLLVADQDLSTLDGLFHHDGLTYIGMRYRVAVPVIAEQTVLRDPPVAHVAGVVVRLIRDRVQVFSRQPFVRDFLRGRVPPMIYVFYPCPGLLIESGERVDGGWIESRPETLTHEPDGALDLSFGLWPIRMAGSRHEPVVTCKIQETRIPTHSPLLVLQHHGFHVVGQRHLGHTSQIVKGMHHATEQSLQILPLRELDVAHPRIAKCQRKQIEMMVEKVAEVRPVELALLARRGLPNPCVASWISTLLNFQEQLVRVVHTLLPPLAKVVAIGIHLARSEGTRRISVRWPMQILTDGLAIQIQSLRNLALAQTKLMQLLNVHPILQVNHRPPLADGRSAHRTHRSWYYTGEFSVGNFGDFYTGTNKRLHRFCQLAVRTESSLLRGTSTGTRSARSVMCLAR